MKPNKTRLTLSILVIAPIIIWTLLPDYLQKAILYQHPGIDDYTLFDNRVVSASPTPVPWPLSAHYNKKPLATQWRDSLEHYKTVAYLVVKNDTLLHEEYWDHYDTTSLSNSFSMAKSIVGLLVGCAIEDGAIKSVDQKAADFLPHLNNEWGAKLTIKDLLTMSSASSWDESYSSATSITTKAYYGKNLNKLMETIKIDEEPGMTFEYESGNTQLLAMIITNATGKTISQYTSEKIWQPLGAQHDALWSLGRADGIEKAYCCFNTNARDFARLGLLILHHGMVNGQQIIPAAYINETITPATYLKNKDGVAVDYYGYHWWLLNYRGMTMPVARGILGQYIIVIPEHNAIVVRLGHERSKTQINNFPIDIYPYVDAALEILEQ